MNLNQLQSFVHVAEYGSFSQAALVLGVAQPALSRQVRALETELRETLLLRNGRGVQVTDAGQRLLEHCQSILQMVEQAKDDLVSQRHEVVGTISIAMPPALARLYTLELVQAFQREMPQAHLAVMEGFSVAINEWLGTGYIDLALAYNPEATATVEITPLWQERACLFSPQGQEPAQPIDISDLSHYPLIMPPRRGHAFREQVESAAAMAGVHLNVVCEVTTASSMLDLVNAGIGHSFAGRAMTKAIPPGHRIAVTEFKEKMVIGMLCMVTHARKRPTPLLKRTMELLKRVVQED